MTARFDQLVRDELAPLLQARGFRKKGLTFARRNDDGWSILQFQKDPEASRTSTNFAINVSTFSDQIDKTLAPLRRLPPVSAIPSVAACHLRRRLQELLPAGAADKHVVDDSTDLALLGATLRTGLETYAIPFLDALATDRGLHAYWGMHAPPTGEQLEFAVLVRAFDTPDALARLAAHLREAGDPAATKVLELLDQIAGLAPTPKTKVDRLTSQIIRSMKAGLAMEDSDPAAFDRALERCIALDDGGATNLRGDAHLPPFRLRPYIVFANALTNRGAPERAIVVAEPALVRWPDEPDLHLVLARAYDTLGDHSGAEQSYRRANEIDPRPYVCVHIAKMIDKQGDRGEEAIEWLHRTLDLDPDYEEAHYNLGYIDERNGDYDAAITRYRRAIELDPNYKEARARLGPLLNRRRS